jgi:outer membrane protein assembly factor BamB
VQGYSASPALFKSAVIVPTDSAANTPHRLTALHRKTGRIVWQVLRPDNRESYASPLVAHVAGRDQLFIVGPDMTRAYDPNNGELLWQCDGPTQYNAATVAFGPQMIYATGGYPGKALLGIRADGSGDVTVTHLVWRSDRKAGYVPSPLLYDGFLYAVSDVGLMRCYDAGSGQVVWEQNLGAPFYSSPVLVGERIYLFDRKGKGYVIKAGDHLEMLAENSLPDGVFATPVICGGRIYLRTLGDFFCLGKSP